MYLYIYMHIYTNKKILNVNINKEKIIEVKNEVKHNHLGRKADFKKRFLNIKINLFLGYSLLRRLYFACLKIKIKLKYIY